jgi:hypothetical protein
MAKKHTGRCACGNVRYEFDTTPDFIADCYCLDCQRASGGVMATWFGVPADDFTLTSGHPKSFRYTADSGMPLDRNFCPDCGSRLFTSHLGAFPGMVFVMIGSMDSSDGIDPKLEIFTKRRHTWLKHPDVPQFTDMPT